jgi:hypothetical protein
MSPYPTGDEAVWPSIVIVATTPVTCRWFIKIPRSKESANARSKGWFMREKEILRYAGNEMSHHKISIAGDHMRKRSMLPNSVGGTRGCELI